MAKTAIELHQDELDAIGIAIEAIEVSAGAVPEAHRDDHYMFVLLQKGTFGWELDFNALTLKGATICFVAPGQVHKYVRFNKAEGWLLFADTKWVAPQYREIFDSFLHNRQAAKIQSGHAVFTLAQILENLLTDAAQTLQQDIIHSIADAIIGMVATALVAEQNTVHTVGSQKYRMATQFKQLVKQQYRNYKQVKHYAALLHITPLYLNEVVKEITGFTASYWIQQEIILEARRLLFYTNMDIKQIAFDLGYEDRAYFSRFFKKVTGITASHFKSTKP